MFRALSLSLSLLAIPVVDLQADENPILDELKLLHQFRTEFVRVTPGRGKFPKSFLPQRGGGEAGLATELTSAFEIAKYEVTQQLWQALMGDNPSRWKGPRNSVEMVSYREAVDFCERATERLRAAKLIDENELVRLPTEVEWEYCARAGTNSKYSFGESIADLDAHAWYTGNAAGNDPPVGAKRPNPWGLYDVHGYLWEWCAPSAEENQDAADPAELRQVARGGSWKSTAEEVTSAARQSLPVGFRDDALGLRCILSKVPATEGGQDEQD